MLVPVSRDFLSNLNSRLYYDRPAHRRSVGLDLDQKYAMQQLDFTLLSTSTPAIAVEMKPKYAVKSPSFPTCKYCMMQAYKKSIDPMNTYPQAYCPLDLFSGDFGRVLKAIEILLDTPDHHHTKLFINGCISSIHQVLLLLRI
jgi:hypothetical protein